MGTAIFTYGTLQIPDVMRAITGRPLKGRNATLSGYGCYRLRGRVYPGITREPGGVVHGTLYPDLDPDTLARLDLFEDDLYERIGVEVTAGNAVLPAEAYVIREDFRHVLSRIPWDIDLFRQKHLARYLKGCRRFYGAARRIKGA